MPKFTYGDYEPRNYPDLGLPDPAVPGTEVDADEAPDFRWTSSDAEVQTHDRVGLPVDPAPTSEPPADEPPADPAA